MLHPRRLATFTAAVATALVALLALDTAAHAAGEVAVQLRGLGGTSVTAGGQGLAFQVEFTNTTSEPLRNVTAIVAVTLDDAPVESIRVRRRQGGDLVRQASGDSVVFADPDRFDLQRGGRASPRQYILSFNDKAPPGLAGITVAAYLDGRTLGSASGSVTVVARGGGGPRVTATEAPNTDPGVQPTFEAGPTYSLAPLPVAESQPRVQASVPKALYVLGSLLIAMGAASLFLIFRPPGRVPARVAGAGPHRLSGPSWHPRGEGVPQAWPTVSPAPEPTRRMPRPVRDPGPRTGGGRVYDDSGPHTQHPGSTHSGPTHRGSTHTGPMRPVRDAGPGEPLPPWQRP